MKKPRCQFNRIPGQCKQYNCCFLQNDGGCSQVTHQDTARKILLAQMKIDDLRRIRSEKAMDPVKKVNKKRKVTC